MEYYPAIKRDKLLINATMWINLKNIILSQRRLIQEYVLYNSIYMQFQNRQNYTNRKQISDWDWGGVGIDAKEQEELF